IWPDGLRPTGCKDLVRQPQDFLTSQPCALASAVRFARHHEPYATKVARRSGKTRLTGGVRAQAKDYRQYCDERGWLRRSNRWQSRLADEAAGSQGLLRPSEIFPLSRCQDSRPQNLRPQFKDGRDLQRG